MEGKFSFDFDVRPCQEAETEALRQEWNEKKKRFQQKEGAWKQCK